MKRIIKNSICILSVILLVTGGLAGASRILERKDSRNKLAEFYENDIEYDVLFFGQSHVLNGVFPMVLWRNYGITSYNMAGHGNRMPLNYWVVKAALKHTTPKVVVLDTAMVSFEDKATSLEQLHISLDAIPYSKLKREMVRDLVDEADRRMDFLWEFSTYHNRWSDLKEEDFRLNLTPEKGAESRINVAVPALNMENVESWSQGETLGSVYLEKILLECEERNIPVLLTYLPFPDDTGWRKEVSLAGSIAKKYGVDFLDYDTLYSLVNANTDFYDRDSHMNPSGAGKITDFLGGYLATRFELEDHRKDPAYDYWWRDYQKYYQFKLENLKKEEELKNVLMLLRDEDISFGIYVKPHNSISRHPVLPELLNNMGMAYETFPQSETFWVINRAKNLKESVSLFEEKETSFGTFRLYYNEDGHLELAGNRGESMILTHEDLGIMIFDAIQKEVIDTKTFNLSKQEQRLTETRE